MLIDMTPLDRVRRYITKTEWAIEDGDITQALEMAVKASIDLRDYMMEIVRNDPDKKS